MGQDFIVWHKHRTQRFLLQTACYQRQKMTGGGNNGTTAIVQATVPIRPSHHHVLNKPLNKGKFLIWCEGR